MQTLAVGCSGRTGVLVKSHGSGGGLREDMTYVGLQSVYLKHPGVNNRS